MVHEDKHLFCVLPYFNGGKIWVSDLHPVAINPLLLRDADIDVLIALLEEFRLPDDFRRNVPSYIKHHYYSLSETSLNVHFNAVFRVISTALERQHNVLIYSRLPAVNTAICIGFLIRATHIAPQYLIYNFLEPIPKTKHTWILSFLDYLENVYPDAVLTLDHHALLKDYDKLYTNWMDESD